MGSPKDTGAGLKAQARANMEQAIAELEKVGIPSIEAQKIVLESPELVGLEEYEEIGPSAMEDLYADPEMVEAQEDVLGALEERGEAGLTAVEKAQRAELLDSVAAQEKSRQATIQREMAERGLGGSGAELAAMLQSSQSAADRGSKQALDLAAQAENRALQALTQRGDLAGQLRSQTMGEAGQRASAKDRIAQMNWQASQDAARRNLERRQRMSELGTQTRTQQQLHNKGLIQQDFQNRMTQAQAKAGARTGQANLLTQQAAMAPKETTTLQDIGSIAQTAGNVGKLFAGGFEDGGVVKDPTNEENKKPATRMQSEFAKNEKEARENLLNGDGPTETHKQYEDRVIREDMKKRFGAVHAQNGNMAYPGLTAGVSGESMDEIDPNNLPSKLEAIKLNEANGIKRTTGEAYDAFKDELGALGGNISSGVEKAASKFKGLFGAGEAPKDDEPSKLDALAAVGSGLQNIAVAEGNTPMPSGVSIPTVDVPRGNLAADMAAKMAPKYEDGGIPRYMDGGIDGLESDSTGEIIPGGSMANDRVDAKLNSGEMVLNVEQQQRLLDLLRGEADKEEVIENEEEIIMDASEATPEQLAEFAKMLGLE